MWICASLFRTKAWVRFLLDCSPWYLQSTSTDLSVASSQTASWCIISNNWWGLWISQLPQWAKHQTWKIILFSLFYFYFINAFSIKRQEKQMWLNSIFVNSDETSKHSDSAVQVAPVCGYVFFTSRHIWDFKSLKKWKQQEPEVKVFLVLLLAGCALSQQEIYKKKKKNLFELLTYVKVFHWNVLSVLKTSTI